MRLSISIYMFHSSFENGYIKVETSASNKIREVASADE